ncbi:MAG: hypothetical protein KQA33_01285, partial [Candidatus Aenigmarchaeota archaeon]|nr:hypothetical protein [Candidatus Aenigmarchaeota archaeon]
VTVTATDNVMMSYLDISSNASLNDRHACTGATCSKTWSTFISAPGVYSFKLIAADTSDNKAIRMKSITVTPDVTPPVLNLTVNPTSITRGQSTTITCAATDAAGIASGWPRIAIKKADGTWVNQTATSYTYTPNFTDPVGTYKVYCAAKDNNNNYGESAPTNLNVTAITGMTVTVTASGSVFNRGDTAIITADVKYPNGAPMTTGTVKATKPSPTPGGEISLSYGSGKWSKSYIIGTNDTTGTWTITTSADDGNGNRGTGTTSATISDKYTVSFIYPNTGSYKRGETVKIIVDVYDANSRKVTGATVNATKPVSGTITLYDDGNHDDGSANDGRYGNSYTIALTDPNSWTLTVTATKSGNTGTSQKIINILPAQLNVLITAPPAGSVYNRGETVPITAEITYPDGSPLTAGTVTATNPTGGTITMTHSSGPTWTGSYVIAPTDPASIWTITVSAQDSGSNSGSAQRQVTISSAYTIIITSPGSGSKYHRGDSFVISAIVKDIHANPVSGANVIATVPNGTMLLNDMGGGSYSNTYTVQASDTTGIKTLTVTGSKDGNSGTDSRTIEVLADTKAPVYSYCQVTPMSGTTYAKGASYKFECTWDDDMVVSDVVFEFNGFAYSYLGGKIGKVGNVYSMILNDLPANVTGWEYKWSAKDNENNWNSTPTWNYVINKAPSTVSLTLSPPSPIVYGTPTTATCTDTNPEADAKLWRDGIDVTTTENGTAVVLPAGTREYACIVAETQNYTSASQMSSYDVGTRPNPVHIWINGKLDQDDTITYGTQSNVTGIATAGTADLWMDEAPVTNPHIATLAAGTYTYKVNTTGDLNYMANVTGITRSLTVERVSSVIDLSVSPVTSTYGTLVTATCSQLAGDNGSTLTLLLDSNVVNTSTSGTVSHSVVASGGTHNYECYYAQTQNYTASTKSVSFTVNKAPVDVRLWLNGNEGNVTQNYGSNTNATATIDVSGLTFYLERNGSIIASGTDRLERTSSLNVGTYNYTAYFPGNENYTADSQTWFVTINPGIVNIDMYLNGIQNGNATQIYGTASNVTATITPNILFYLYRNGIQVDTGTSVLEDIETLAAGTYNYTAYFPGDTNYPAVSKTYFLRIEKATPVSAGNLIPASPITYGTPTTFQCNIGNTDSGVTYKLWYHDNSGGPWMELLNNTPEVYPAGEWLHYCNSTESENFTAAEFFTNVPYIVNKAMPTLTLLLNGTDSDYTMERGSSISIEATLSIPGDLHLLVNGSEIATGPSPLTTSYSSIMPGQHNITAVFEGNENYTAVSAQHWLTVQDTTAPIITILSPANTTYNMMSLDLNWTASEPLSWAGYSLDGAPNVTLTGNTSLTPGAGTHTITIYGTDNAGLTGSDSVTFTMECVSHIFNSTIDNT